MPEAPATTQAPPQLGSHTVGAPPLAVVVDTNVWLDLYVFHDAAATAIAQGLAGGSLRALRTAAMDAEIETVLARPAIARHYEPAAIVQAWAHWNTVSDRITAEAGTRAPWICRDRDDQKFLDLAHSRRAAWLFSKDRAVLALAKRARAYGLRIATPQDYARAVQAE